MKKAKILLTAVALFAVAGGALAIKVRQPNLFYKKTAATGACNVETRPSLTTTALGGFTTPLSIASTTATTCGTIRVTTQL